MMKTVVISVVAAAIAAFAAPTVARAAEPAVGNTAPAVELTSADGELRSLATQSGATVLIFYRGLW